MTKDEPYLPWPSGEDKVVVAEMLSDSQSEQWDGCLTYIEKIVHSNAKNISQDAWADIVQEALKKVALHLPHFRFECLLTSWIFRIVQTCIVNEYRRSRCFIKYNKSLEAIEQIEVTLIHMSASPETTFEVKEDLQKVVNAIQEFVSLHNKPARNRKILQMVLLENASLEEAAQAVGCSSAVAGYIVRIARTFLHKKLSE